MVGDAGLVRNPCRSVETARAIGGVDRWGVSTGTFFCSEIASCIEQASPKTLGKSYEIGLEMLRREANAESKRPPNPYLPSMVG